MPLGQPQPGAPSETVGNFNVPLYSQQPEEVLQDLQDAAEQDQDGEETAVAEPDEQQEIDFAAEEAPEEWSPEMRAEWDEAEKRRIGDYTRKTQNLAERRKTFEAKEASLSALEQKAANYDQLMANPAALRQMLGITEQPNGNGQADPAATINPRDVLKDEAYDAVSAVVGEQVNERMKALEDQLSKYRGYIDGIAQRDIKTEWDGLKKEFPSAAQHEQAVAQFAQQHGVTDMRQALFAVAGDSLSKDASTALLKKNDVAQRRRARVPTQASVAQGKTQPHDKEMTLMETFEQVRREAGM